MSWVYAFRFLRVTLSLEVGSTGEVSSALHHLRSIGALAKMRGDHAVFVMAATLQAQSHLRSSRADAIEEAQRALAEARALQTLDRAKTAPLAALTLVMDLLCSLMDSKPSQAMPKMQALREFLDRVSLEQDLSLDGSFTLPVRRDSSSNNSLQSVHGVLRSGADDKAHGGMDRLEFSWMPARDVYALGYFLSGVSSSHRNSYDGQKAEKFLEEGLKMTAGRPKHDNTVRCASTHDLGRGRRCAARRWRLPVAGLVEDGMAPEASRTYEASPDLCSLHAHGVGRRAEVPEPSTEGREGHG